MTKSAQTEEKTRLAIRDRWLVKSDKTDSRSNGWPPTLGVLHRCEKKGVAEKGICIGLKTKTIGIEGGEGGIWKLLKRKEGWLRRGRVVELTWGSV